MAKAYLVPTFHHDIAYLRPEGEYTARCFEILDEALHILQKDTVDAFRDVDFELFFHFWMPFIYIVH